MDTAAKVTCIKPNGKRIRVYASDRNVETHIGCLLSYIKANGYDKKHSLEPKYHFSNLITDTAYKIVREGEMVYLNVQTDVEGIIFLPKEMTPKQKERLITFLETKEERSFLVISNMYLAVEEKTKLEKKICQWMKKSPQKVVLELTEEKLFTEEILTKLNPSKTRMLKKESSY